MQPVYTGQPVDNNQNVNANPLGGQPAAVAPADAAVQAAAQARFRDLYTFETRLAESHKLRTKHPDRYPVIVERDPRAILPLVVKKMEFLPQGNVSLNRLMLRVPPELEIGRQAPLAVMVENGPMVSGDSSIGVLYEQFRHRDGFLYLLFSGDV